MERQFFAQINNDNVVLDVRCVTKQFLDANPERYTGTWVETFFNTAGKTYAGVGYEYLPSTKNFRPQQPYPSWTWANDIWNPPTPRPSTGGPYEWSEEDLVWVAV